MFKLMYLIGYIVKYVVVNLYGFSFRIYEYLKDGIIFFVNVSGGIYLAFYNEFEVEK